MFARLLNWGETIPKRQLKASPSNAANVSLHLLEVANYIYSPPKNPALSISRYCVLQKIWQ